MKALDFVCFYLDDIVLFSKTIEEHMDHLRIVIERIAAHGLRLKIPK